MERKNYSKPFMYTERFTPQEYCVLCWKTSLTLWKEANGVPGLQETAVVIAPESTQKPRPGEAFIPYQQAASDAGHLQALNGGQYKILPDESTGWKNIQTNNLPVRFYDCSWYPALVNTTSVTREYWMIEATDNNIYYCNNMGFERDTVNRS